MNDFKNEAREFFERAKEKIDPIAADVREAAAPVIEDVKAKAAPVIEDMKIKAAPVIDDVKEAGSEFIEDVGEGARKLGSFISGVFSGSGEKNELFTELGQQAASTLDTAKARAEEMHQRLREMMNGDKD